MMRCGPSWKISPILATAVARIGLKRPLLQPLCGVAENDMIDLGRREPGDLYGRVQQNQFFKLDLQRVEIPLSFFCQSIDGKPKYAVFGGAQMARRARTGLDRGPIASPPRSALRRQ